MIKQGTYGPTPIPLPDIDPTVGGLRKYAKQVRTAIAALRDRQVSVRIPPGAPAPSHPWKATANGDETVAVAAGCIMGMYSSTEDSAGGAPSSQSRFFSPFIGIYKKFEGASIEITAATGYVYAKCDFSSTVEGYEFGSNLEIGGNLYYPNTTPSLVFSDLGPGSFDPSSEDSPVGDMYFPIAEVSVTDNVAKVDFQVLTHNPVIQLDDIEHAFTP